MRVRRIPIGQIGEIQGGRPALGAIVQGRDIGEANGWKRLMSNSAKLVNILGGYGYEPILDSMSACVESAIAGRIVGAKS